MVPTAPSPLPPPPLYSRRPPSNVILYGTPWHTHFLLTLWVVQIVYIVFLVIFAAVLLPGTAYGPDRPQHEASKIWLRFAAPSLLFPFSGITLFFVFLQILSWKLRRDDNGKPRLHPTVMVIMYSLTSAMWFVCMVFSFLIIAPSDSDFGGNIDGFSKWEASFLCDAFTVIPSLAGLWYSVVVFNRCKWDRRIATDFELAERNLRG
ncbi:hypothetical protein B0O99DRAFT_625368 [Bisporella sp. PMI_857]|nr:hypothetical protein B0O99DRAFT_625368 [Bisporella sp. PMI_857]